jgi:heme/copper-type cytochrome/quinol oxidase subunit 2
MLKKISVIQVAQVLAFAVSLLLLAVPFVAGAQFTTPDPGGTGLPGDTSITGFILRIINIALAIAGLVAVLFLIIGGFRYITAGGNEESGESARKIITNAIIGIVVIILSFVIVRVISNALLIGGSA